MVHSTSEDNIALRFHLLFKEGRPEQRRGVRVPLPTRRRMSLALRGECGTSPQGRLAEPVIARVGAPATSWSARHLRRACF